MGDDDKIIRLYTRLESLKKNLPQDGRTHERYIREYHLIVQELENIAKLDLSEFKVAEGEIGPLLASYSYLSGEKHYTKERFCDREFLLAKLDALLGYFQIKYFTEHKRTIGFKQNG